MLAQQCLQPKLSRRCYGSELWAAIGCPLWWRHLVNAYGVKA